MSNLVEVSLRSFGELCKIDTCTAVIIKQSVNVHESLGFSVFTNYVLWIVFLSRCLRSMDLFFGNTFTTGIQEMHVLKCILPFAETLSFRHECIFILDVSLNHSCKRNKLYYVSLKNH